jgi:hypothetical protein
VLAVNGVNLNALTRAPSPHMQMLAYNVEMVPCFVLLNAAGNAVCKTPPPRSRQQMEAALSEMVQHATQLAR